MTRWCRHDPPVSGEAYRPRGQHAGPGPGDASPHHLRGPTICRIVCANGPSPCHEGPPLHAPPPSRRRAPGDVAPYPPIELSSRAPHLRETRHQDARPRPAGTTVHTSGTRTHRSPGPAPAATPRPVLARSPHPSPWGAVSCPSSDPTPTRDDALSSLERDAEWGVPGRGEERYVVGPCANPKDLAYYRHPVLPPRSAHRSRCGCECGPGDPHPQPHPGIQRAIGAAARGRVAGTAAANQPAAAWGADAARRSTGESHGIRSGPVPARNGHADSGLTNCSAKSRSWSSTAR